MNFSSSDFDSLKYPVHKKAPSKIPDLMALDGMAALDEREVAYIVYMFDQASPFQKISDMNARREFAADKAGYDVDKEDLEWLHGLKKPETIKAVISYLKDGKNLEFATLSVFEHRFYENLNHLLTPLDDVDVDGDVNTILKGAELKSKLENSTIGLISTITEMRSKVFGGDANLQRIVESFTPELISKKLKNVR